MIARPAGPPAGESGARSPAAALFPRVAPFALFIALLAAQPLLEGHVDTRWLVALRGIAVGALLAAFWPRYGELRRPPRARPWHWAAAIALGAAIFVLWISLDAGWAVMGSTKAGFVPQRADGSIDATLVVLRVVGLALVVPVMEELFWRSFLMRWIDRKDFLAADPRATGFAAFALSSALFALEHAQWFAGLIAGAAYAWLYIRSSNLWIPIVSHATTNALLAAWILATHNWHFW